MKKNISPILILTLIIGILIGHFLPFLIPVQLRICNESKYDVSWIKSEYYYAQGIKKGTCITAQKKKILRKQMPLEVNIQKNEKDPTTRIKFSISSFTDQFGDAPLLFGKKTLIITNLYESDIIHPYHEVGGVNYIWK